MAEDYQNLNDHTLSGNSGYASVTPDRKSSKSTDLEIKEHIIETRIVEEHPNGIKKTTITNENIKIPYERTQSTLTEMGYHACKQTSSASATSHSGYDMGSTVSSFEYTAKVNDNPLEQSISRVLLESDLVLLRLNKNIEPEEPVFTLFGSGTELCKPANGGTPQDFTRNIHCADCDSEICDEYLFGKYCVAAVHRYMEENLYKATMKNAYVTYIAHYNRAMDIQSFEENEGVKLRESKICRALMCMKNGSLKYSMHWIKWKMNTGPLKDFYDNEERKQKRKAKLDYHKKMRIGEIKQAKRR